MTGMHTSNWGPFPGQYQVQETPGTTRTLQEIKLYFSGIDPALP